MSPTKQLLWALAILHTCTAMTMKKNDSTNSFQTIPPEILTNIISHLSSEEQNKAALISSEFSEVNFLLKEKSKSRAFKNYLMYPYLSYFYKDFDEKNKPNIRMPNRYVTELQVEKESLNDIFKTDNNKKLFYQFLLKEVHPDYFEILDWMSYFNLKHSQVKVHLDQENLNFFYYVRLISISNEERSVLMENDIHHVLIIDFDRIKETFPNRIALSEDIIELIKTDFSTNHHNIQQNDNIRIIFKDDELMTNQNKNNGENFMNKLLQYCSSIGTTLFNDLKEKYKINVKIIDLTSIYPKNPFLGLSIPHDISNFMLYMTFNPAMYNQQQLTESNIVVKPYYNENLNAFLKNIDQLEQTDFFMNFYKYLCDQNFGLVLAQNIGFYSNWTSWKNRIELLQQYVSPFAMMHDGRNFLDIVFDFVIKKVKTDGLFKIVNEINVEENNQIRQVKIFDNQLYDVIDFFISLVKSHNIDINSYIGFYFKYDLPFKTKGTFLTRLFSVSRDFIDADTYIILIDAFMKKGLNPMLVIWKITVLECFFSDLSNNINFLNIFEKIVQYQTIAKNKELFYNSTSPFGNTILHSFFQYADFRTANVDNIRNMLRKFENKFNVDTINARNNAGETIIEIIVNNRSLFEKKNSTQHDIQDFILDWLDQEKFDFSGKTKNGKQFLSLGEGATQHRENFFQTLKKLQFKANEAKYAQKKQ